MYTLSTNVDCGLFTVTFLQKKTSAGETVFSALDTAIFSVDQTNEHFKKLTSSDTAQAGTYDLVYSVSLQDYGGVFSAQSNTPFVYTIIVDPCTPPTLTLTVPNGQPTGLTYSYENWLTITPIAYVASPTVCTVAYECTILGGPAGHFTNCIFSDTNANGLLNLSTGVW